MNIELLPLYAEIQGHPKLEIIKHYARANVAHATAAKDAEIEALRAEVDEQCRLHAIGMERELALIARAERLAEALRKLEEREQSDEALLRQALEALERGAWDTLSGRNAAFAIRERLGLGQENGDA